MQIYMKYGNKLLKNQQDFPLSIRKLGIQSTVIDKLHCVRWSTVKATLLVYRYRLNNFEVDSNIYLISYQILL